MSCISYKQDIPVLDKYDVLVAGSGPSGICAAVAASREGARTAIIERYGIVGGNLTSGCVGPIMGQVGPGTMRDELTARLGVRGNDMLGYNGKVHDIEHAKAKLLAFLREAKVDVYLQTPIIDTLMEGRRAYGVLLGTKEGIAAMEAGVIIDATGDGDVAYFAGATYNTGREGDGRVQPVTIMYVLGGVDESCAIKCMGEADPVEFRGEPFPTFTQRCCDQGLLPPNTGAVRLYPTATPGERLVNCTQVNDIYAPDAKDIIRAEEELRDQIWKITDFLRKNVPGYEQCFVKHSATTLGVRESRRFIGVESVVDADVTEGLKKKNVVVHNANFLIDIHNPTGSGQAETFDRVFSNHAYDIPYGALVPQNTEGILLTGRCISGTHRAHASYRIMSVCMALGEAAGIAGAMCAKKRIEPRDLDVAKLQHRLMEKGIVLFDKE